MLLTYIPGVGALDQPRYIRNIVPQSSIMTTVNPSIITYITDMVREPVQ